MTKNLIRLPGSEAKFYQPAEGVELEVRLDAAPLVVVVEHVWAVVELPVVAAPQRRLGQSVGHVLVLDVLGSEPSATATAVQTMVPDTFSRIVEAFAASQFEVLRERADDLDRLKKLLRKRKDELFDLQADGADRVLLEYPLAR